MNRREKPTTNRPRKFQWTKTERNLHIHLPRTNKKTLCPRRRLYNQANCVYGGNAVKTLRSSEAKDKRNTKRNINKRKEIRIYKNWKKNVKHEWIVAKTYVSPIEIVANHQPAIIRQLKYIYTYTQYVKIRRMKEKLGKCKAQKRETAPRHSECEYCERDEDLRGRGNRWIRCNNIFSFFHFTKSLERFDLERARHRANNDTAMCMANVYA